MALTDAKREGNARHLEELKAKGWKKVTVWLSPDAQATVADLKVAHGSFNGGLEALNRGTPQSAKPKIDLQGKIGIHSKA